jgi:prepilin peptidase CpaA
MMHRLTLLAFAPLIALLIWAAVIDWRHRRIPNWLTLAVIAGGLARGMIFGQMEQAVLGLLVGASIPLGMFLLRALGGGDVKLMAGVGAWLGPRPSIAVFAVAAIFGLLIVITQAITQRRLKAVLRNTATITVNLASASQVGLKQAIESSQAAPSIDRPLPYAIPVLAATVTVICFGG